ncbi:hypothetical protein D5086_008780 [Populus alba]|uniref:Uncharacterized protein n=1 Tax=Populus alba TaxID=43335 RepID=A0ACC4CGG8_POPAL
MSMMSLRDVSHLPLSYNHQIRNWDEPFEKMCDVSDYGVRDVLGQRIGKKLHVIAYASHMLDGAQCNYLTIKKELFAAVYALEKFKSYLLEFDIGIKDKKGSENHVVDHLSRLRTKDIQTETIRETFLDEQLYVLHSSTRPWIVRKLQLQELEEIWNDAYENARIYKEKTKSLHD